MAAEPLLRGGQKCERIKGQIPPCRWCPKIPKGAEPIPSNAVELSSRNWTAYQHYLECKAVGATDAERRDPIVRRNAMLIEQIVDANKRNDSGIRDLVALIAKRT